jgi:hypothetical protein
LKYENPYPIILNFLSEGWHVPHEVSAELRRNKYAGSYDAVTARMRDLRKPRYGSHDLVKRRRAGTDYFEYRVEARNERAA